MCLQNSEDTVLHLMVTLRTAFRVFYDCNIFTISWSVSFSNPIYFEFWQLLITTRTSLLLGADILLHDFTENIFYAFGMIFSSFYDHNFPVSINGFFPHEFLITCIIAASLYAVIPCL